VNIWIAGARPRTLPAAVVPVLVGTAAAAGDAVGVGPSWLKGVIVWRFVAAAVVAVAIQVGTNYANDYSDGVKGTDTDARVGPVRLVGSGLASPGAVKRAAFAAFGVAAVGGLALAAAVSWWLIPLGAVCFAAGWFYTGGPRPYGYAGLGELFVFVFFGLVATVGSAYVQTGTISGLALAASVPVGFLATALLVVNNLRDIPTDTAAGKRTLAVKLGDPWTRRLYVALLAGTFVGVPFVSGLGGRPLGAVSLVAILLAQRPALYVLEGRTGPALIEVLGMTGRVQLVFGLAFSAGLFISATY
jgi:1,4-dihydroxy-2-naphthoate octaprenyltransferase